MNKTWWLALVVVVVPIPALAAWDGFTDESATLGTSAFSFVGTNPAAGDTNEHYYDGDFGDFDGDGLLDRALIARYGLLLNTGGGRMTPVANTITGGTYVFGDKDAIGNDAVEWADVDGDGDLDSVQGGNGEALVLQINRQGRFNTKWTKSNGAKRIIGIDIERDGDVDLVVSACFCLTRNCGQPDGFALLVNDGAGNFTEESAARGLAYGNKLVVGVIAGDIDRDGDFDLLLASGDTTGAGAPAGTSMKMLALRNNGSGVFSETAFYDIPAAVAGLGRGTPASAWTATPTSTSATSTVMATSTSSRARSVPWVGIRRFTIHCSSTMAAAASASRQRPGSTWVATTVCCSRAASSSSTSTTTAISTS